MRRLVAFHNVTLDGFFADSSDDISWAHRDAGDAEWSAFVADNASAGDTLVFGRITYELMASYWPTPLAIQNDPVVAGRMNSMTKVVFSRTLREASWSHSTLVEGDVAAELRRMKREPGGDMAILGSGSIVSQAASEGLIDELQIVVNPVVLGKGRTLFDGIRGPLDLELTKTRTFANGNVLLCYAQV